MKKLIALMLICIMNININILYASNELATQSFFKLNPSQQKKYLREEFKKLIVQNKSPEEIYRFIKLVYKTPNFRVKHQIKMFEQNYLEIIEIRDLIYNNMKLPDFFFDDIIFFIYEDKLDNKNHFLSLLCRLVDYVRCNKLSERFCELSKTHQKIVKELFSKNIFLLDRHSIKWFISICDKIFFNPEKQEKFFEIARNYPDLPKIHIARRVCYVEDLKKLDAFFTKKSVFDDMIINQTFDENKLIKFGDGYSSVVVTYYYYECYGKVYKIAGKFSKYSEIEMWNTILFYYVDIWNQMTGFYQHFHIPAPIFYTENMFYREYVEGIEYLDEDTPEFGDWFYHQPLGSVMDMDTVDGRGYKNVIWDKGENWKLIDINRCKLNSGEYFMRTCYPEMRQRLGAEFMKLFEVAYEQMFIKVYPDNTKFNLPELQNTFYRFQEYLFGLKKFKEEKLNALIGHSFVAIKAKDMSA